MTTSRLAPVGDDIWIAEGGTVNFYGFPYPTRSVIVRLEADELWIWSPIALSDSLRRAVEAIGRPRHLISPNKIHHLYLTEWKAAYPSALLWGPRSSIRKRKDLTFETPLGDTPPEAWREEFDQAWFHGSILMDEVVFLHRKSGTVIIADMSENFTSEFLVENWSGWKRWIARRWGIVEGEGYAPLELRLAFIRRAPLRRARDKVLAWRPESVVMAHGRWLKGGGQKYLKKAFEWIG